MQPPRRVEIRKQTRLFDDFFKIDEIIVAHEQLDATMSADQRRLVFERGDAVAVMLYNRDKRSVVLVDQFKVPTLIGRRRDQPGSNDGWITETMAGMVGPNETAEAAVIRETMEETGYRIRDPKLICRFFSSPGGTSERIFLYYAEVTEADKLGKGGGIDDEDVRVVDMSLLDLFDRLEAGLIEDPKLAIAAYWLKDFLRQPEPLEFSAVHYEMKDKPGLIVGYKTGAIDKIHGVSIWVNSENIYMMMDRFIGKSISAQIRHLGANKDGDSVVEDTIQESLRSAMGERQRVEVGTVLVTEPGMLRSHKVERIFHVATVVGAAGTGVEAKQEHLRTCVHRVLMKADEENKRPLRMLWRMMLKRPEYQSILFPMLGAGEGGLTVDEVAEAIIPAAVDYYRTIPDPTLKEIYFLAYRPRDKRACERVFERYREEGTLVPAGQAK